MKYLRTSERNLFKSCQWAWQKSYIDQIEPKGRLSAALWFGTGIHEALEHMYRSGASPVDTWIDYCLRSQASPAFMETYEGGDYQAAVDAQELGTAMLTAYQEHYAQDYIEPIAVELPFQVDIPHVSIQRTKSGHVEEAPIISRYVGTIDLIYRDKRDGKVYLMDHKTASALGSSATQYLPLDDQAGAYMAFATKVLREKNLIGQKEMVSGIVYNYLVKKMPDTRPRNADGFCTNKPIKKHYLAAMPDLDSKLKIADLEAEAVKRGITVLGDVSQQQPFPMFDRVVVYKTPAQMAKQVSRVKDDLRAMSLVWNNVLTPTKTPTRTCGFCPFNTICEIDEQGRDYSETVESGYQKWSPYESHIS